MKFGKEAKELFGLDPGTTFLNNGSFGTVPLKLRKATFDLFEEIDRNPVKFFIEENYPRYEKSLQSLGDFLHTDYHNLVLIDNATTGVDTVLNYLAQNCTKCEEVLINSQTYPAVKNAVRHFSKISGVQVSEITLPFPVYSDDEIMDTYKKSIHPNTTLAILDHVGSAVGFVYPVEKLAAYLKSQGVQVIIDGAHAPGMLDLHLDDIQCDYYIGNCHKWLFAPRGTAFLYAKKENLDALNPLAISLFYGGGPQKEFFWTGTRVMPGWVLLDQAIEFYNSFGEGEVMKYNNELCLGARNLIREKCKMLVSGNPDMNRSMASFHIKSIETPKPEMSEQLRKMMLEKYGIEVPFSYQDGKILVRISCQIYNEIDEYVKFADAINSEF